MSEKVKVCVACGMPQVDQAFTLLMHFKSKDERNVFAAMVKQELTTVDAYRVTIPDKDS